MSGTAEQLPSTGELPRATVAVLDLAAHHLGRIERPTLYAALLRDWLERIESPLEEVDRR